ncbi:hypothetical protein QFC21_006486 [Naganishia friedmannii]|uniref:Uncharacterized protein n=1 Tax=Naganishia friedmannii TaxID=89922 RepID=A0ACC2V1V0_9TREE|nr:hypothetical protein QFC21_006486 [Naganishia friedmannii]
MAQSPPTYHYIPTSITHSPPDSSWRDRNRGRRPSNGAGENGVDVVRDLGMMMSSLGASPIEEYTPHQHHKHTDDPVPGIDVRNSDHHHHHHQHQQAQQQHARPTIGIIRPSDEGEDKRRLVQEWTVNGLGGKEISKAKKKTVDFATAITATYTDPYPATRTSSFASTATSSSSNESIDDSALIYSPNYDSLPLHIDEYAGTILNLVTDPEEIREYRQLESKKDFGRKDSTASAASSSSIGSGGSGGLGTDRKASRLGSGSWGRNVRSEEKDKEQDAISPPSSCRRQRQRQPHPHLTHSTYTNNGAHGGRRTTLADLFKNDNLAHFDAQSGIGVRQPFPSHQSTEMRDMPASPRSSIRFSNIAHDSSAGTTHGESSTADVSSPVSSKSASSTIHASAPANRPLFHPDLHPVADHHASSAQNNDNDDDDMTYQMPSSWSSSSLPENAMFTLTEPLSRREDTSPSSADTIRPPLLAEGGKAKAHTVADYRSLDEEWMA